MERGLYSFNGNIPQELPDYWKFPDGTVRENLQDLSDAELNSFGWIGPIDPPPTILVPEDFFTLDQIPEKFLGTSHYTHKYLWNSEKFEYEAIEFTLEEKQKSVNYQRFWDNLLKTDAYPKIKDLAKTSIEANAIITEFIALITDAKMGHPNIQKIQESLSDIIQNLPLTQHELDHIKMAFIDSGMFAIYTINI